MAIKANLRQQFLTYLNNNQDIASVVQHAVNILDQNKTPMQTEDALHEFELTAFGVGSVAQALIRFHSRGEEFKAYWIKRNNVPENTNFEETIVGFPIPKRKS